MSTTTPFSSAEAVTHNARQRQGFAPRLGFLGVGWIGRNRLEAIARSGAGRVVAIADPAREMRDAAAATAPDAEMLDSLDDLLGVPLDGIVIATPSALHAGQSLAAIRKGLAVFCQKPLARTAAEATQVVEAARRADLLLGVDLSYRFVEAFRRVREEIRSGSIGEVFAAELTFHNAYGPDKDWFYDPRLAGGGCVMDLGIHLVDLALWSLGFPAVERLESRRFARGRPALASDMIEDFATAHLTLSGGRSVNLACSWNLSAGQDAVISAVFHGTEGGLAVNNVEGSFYDFIAERYEGTRRDVLVTPPDAWGGRAAVEWARQLASGAGFQPSAEDFIKVAEILDLIYGR